MHRASMICGRCFSMFCVIPVLIDASMFDKTSGVEFHNIAQHMVLVPHGQIPGFCFNLPCLRNAEVSILWGIHTYIFICNYKCIYPRKTTKTSFCWRHFTKIATFDHWTTKKSWIGIVLSSVYYIFNKKGKT